MRGGYDYNIIQPIPFSRANTVQWLRTRCQSLVLVSFIRKEVHHLITHSPIFAKSYGNKANLRDLIAATGLVILLKLDSNRWFFSTCELEIWWMTPKNNTAPLLYYIKLCASFQIHQWVQTGVTVRKRPIWVKIEDFFSRVTLQFDIWPWKTIGHIFYANSSFMHHFVAIGEFKLELQSGNTQSTIFLAVWPCNLTHDLEKE